MFFIMFLVFLGMIIGIGVLYLVGEDMMFFFVFFFLFVVIVFDLM